MRRESAAVAISLGICALSLGYACDTRVVIADSVSDVAGGGQGGAPAVGDGGGAGTGGIVAQGRPIFGAPRRIEELSEADSKDQDPTLTGDELEIYFFSDRSGNEELWTARRASLTTSWDAPTLVEELSDPELDINPAVSRDGLRLWFHTQRAPSGIWLAERSSRNEPWGAPTPVVGFEGEIAPAPSVDELRMGYSVFDEATKGRDVHEATRQNARDPWGNHARVRGINADADDSTPFYVGDGTTILFSSSRSGAGDLYVTRRESLDAAASVPEAFDELNDPDFLDTHPHLSPDGERIYFGSARSGVADLYEALAATP